MTYLWPIWLMRTGSVLKLYLPIENHILSSNWKVWEKFQIPSCNHVGSPISVMNCATPFGWRTKCMRIGRKVVTRTQRSRPPHLGRCRHGVGQKGGQYSPATLYTPSAPDTGRQRDHGDGGELKPFTDIIINFSIQSYKRLVSFGTINDLLKLPGTSSQTYGYNQSEKIKLIIFLHLNDGVMIYSKLRLCFIRVVLSLGKHNFK